MRNRRAVLVGINGYDEAPDLTCSVDDAREMMRLLCENWDESTNYHCRLLTSDETRVTRAALREALRELMDARPDEDLLFYFSGHGITSDIGGFLVTQDGVKNDQGLSMQELLRFANGSDARSVLLILDSCHSGELGSTAGGNDLANRATLALGVTILASSSPTQEARESLEHSLFTNLLVQALEGGAADARGRVSAAAMYAYAEQILGPWDQRPMYKSHAQQLAPVRLCEPAITDKELRDMAALFGAPDIQYKMGPTYEHSHPSARKEHVAIFDLFKRLRNAGLIRTENDKDLYYVALDANHVTLSPKGAMYWQLASKGRL